MVFGCGLWFSVYGWIYGVCWSGVDMCFFGLYVVCGVFYGWSWWEEVLCVFCVDVGNVDDWWGWVGVLCYCWIGGEKWCDKFGV